MSNRQALKYLGGVANVRPVKASKDHPLPIIEAVRAGFSTKAVVHLKKAGKLSTGEIAHVIAPLRSLAHRKKSGRLSPEQSERAYRVAQVLAAAEDTFGHERAALWLRRPTVALGNQSPMSLLDTAVGAEAVLALLGRIDHGIAA